jgi:hypothetical protein
MEVLAVAQNGKLLRALRVLSQEEFPPAEEGCWDL